MWIDATADEEVRTAYSIAFTVAAETFFRGRGNFEGKRSAGVTGTERGSALGD